MKSLLLVIPFLLVGLVPVAFGQVVETTGQNYDLIEDYNIGEATWKSHPERIMVNGEWENYFLQADDQKIVFRSNSVGGFIYDIPSCSYSIYENGFNGNQIIPSVSSVASYNVNGNWQNMAVNQEECLVNFSQGDNGIFITSTKTLFGETNQPIFQSYNGTGSTVNVNGTSYNVVSNGNQTGYYVDNFVPVETEKFVQELKVDIFGGIKETFKVWNESDEPLGISQTVHTGESITIGENTLNIAELNGQSFNKQFLEDNQAQVFEIAESLNYDFKDGFDSLSNVNIFFDGNYKVNLDYASGDFVNYLEIDPVFSSTGRTYWILASTLHNTFTYGGGTWFQYFTNGGGSGYAVGAEYDTSSIPPSSLITGATFSSETRRWGSGSIDCQIVTMTNTPNYYYNFGTISGMSADINSSTTYLTNDSSFCVATSTTSSVPFTSTFNTAGISYFQNSISNGENVHFGFKSTYSGSGDMGYHTGGSTSDVFTLTYELQNPPDVPTNLSATTGIPIGLTWTAPVDDGGLALTGYKVYRTTQQYPSTELPNNGGTTGVDFTNNELLLHFTDSTDSSPNSLEFLSTNPTRNLDYTECTDATCGGIAYSSNPTEGYIDITNDNMRYRNVSDNSYITLDSFELFGDNNYFGNHNGNQDSFIIRHHFKNQYNTVSPNESDGFIGLQETSLVKFPSSGTNDGVAYSCTGTAIFSHEYYCEYQRYGIYTMNYRASSFANYVLYSHGTYTNFATPNGNAGTPSGTAPYGYVYLLSAGNTGSNIFSSGINNQDKYFEWVFHKGTNNDSYVTLQAFSDATYTTPLQTSPTTITIGLSDDEWDELRYFTLGDIYTSSNGAGNDIYTNNFLEYYFGTTDVDDGAQVVFTLTDGVLSTGVSSPNFSATSSLLPDATDSFTVGSWVKLDVDTPTFEDDFSTDKGWVVNDANKINVDYTTNNRIDYDIIRDDTNDKAYIDLGTTVSDTAWVLRFHHYLTTFSGTINKQMMIGLSDNTGSSSVTLHDVIYMNLNLQDSKYYLHSVDNAITSSSSSSDLGVTPTSSQEFWFELKRTSATTATLTAYSDSTYSTVAYTTNYSIASTTDNLRYLFVDHKQNPSTDSGTLVGYIDDIEFYDGVTSVSTTPTNTKLLGVQTSSGGFEFDIEPTSATFSKLVSGQVGSAQNPLSTSNTSYADWYTYRSDTGQLLQAWTNDFYFYQAYTVGAQFDTTSIPTNAIVTGVTFSGNSVIYNGGNTANCQLVKMTNKPESYVSNPSGLKTDISGNYAGGSSNYLGTTTSGWCSNTTFTDTFSSTGIAYVQSLISAGEPVYFGFYNSNTGANGYSGADDSPNLTISYYYTGLTKSPIISATGLTDNTSAYQHYALTRDNSLFTLYQNGQSVATATDSTDFGSTSVTSRDSTLDGTNNGATTGQTGKVDSYAWSFDGSNDYITVGDTSSFSYINNPNQVSTVAFWYKSGTSPTSNFDGIVATVDASAPSSTGFEIGRYQSSGAGLLELTDATGGKAMNDVITNTGLFPVDNTWYHYVFVFDNANSQLKIYKNNSLFQTISYGSWTPSTNGATQNPLNIGRDVGNSKYANLQLDQVLFYDDGLTTQEISDLYNSNSGTTTVPTGNLVAHYNFEQTGSTLENQIYSTIQNPHTINLDGLLDEYFIDSTALTSNEIQTVYEMGTAPSLLATTGTTPSYNDSGVTGGNTYYYYVKASNAIGDSDFSAQVTGLAGTPPDAPTGLSATIQNTATAPRDIFLQWSAPTNVGSGTLTGFEIWRDGSLVTTVGLVSSYVDIVPTVGTYTYTVKAVATHGTSVDSNSAQITTPNLPDAPQGLTLSIDNPNPSPLTVTVTVSPPLNDGGSAVTGYNIYTSTDDITYTLQASNVGNPSNITVPSAGVWFFKAEAVNGVGAGALSSNAIIGTPNVPDAPSLSLAINDPNANPLTITTTFTEGATNGGSAVTGFNLYSSPDDINYNLVAGDISSPYSTTVSNAGTWYFKAEAVNNVGNSLASISYSITTPTVPNAPASVSTNIPDIDNAPSSVVITWTAPTNNGGSILTGYKVYRDTSLITTVGAGIFTFTDTDVKTVNTQYTYEVRATNNVGEGLGTTSNITTPNTPLAPTLSILSGTTKLTWTTPTSDGTITGYKIYRDSSLIKTTGLVLTYTDMSVLNWSNSYDYEVSAVSTIGEGALSNTVIGQNFDTNVDDATAFGTTGTSSIIDWTEPPYFQGNVTSYSIYYSTPYSSNPSTLIGTTGNTYLNLYNQLQYDTNYAFLVLVNSPLGNTSVGNVVNATTTENLGIVTYDPTTGANWFDIDAVNQEDLSTTRYTRVDNGDTVLLEIEYPTNYEDMTCDVGFKFGQQTLQYVEGEDMTATALDAEHQAVVMQFNNQGNEVITVECADQNVPNSASSYTVTTTFGNFPLLTQIADFRTGEYGTNGMFGALDLITLFVVIISMVGFNRINPIAGVIMGVSAISGLAYFGVINLPPAIIGIFALLAFLAWGVTRK